MSLDTTDFILAVEDHFGIELNHVDGELVPTIGDFADHILSEVLARWAGVICPTRRAFFKLRTSLCNSLQVEGLKIRPSTRLDELIPHSRRKSDAIRLRYDTLPQYQTVGDLARKSIGWFIGHHGVHGITKQTVLNDLIPIVGYELGVDADKLHADIRFVEDLDVG